MTSIDELFTSYLAIRNEPDAATRRDLIAQAWTEDASYVDPLLKARGHHGIETMVAGFQAQVPGLEFRRPMRRRRTRTASASAGSSSRPTAARSSPRERTSRSSRPAGSAP